MRRLVLALVALLFALPVLAVEVPSCLVPGDPSVCDPAWIPDSTIFPGYFGLTRVRPQATIAVSPNGLFWEVTVTYTATNHPGLVKFYTFSNAVPLETWTGSVQSAYGTYTITATIPATTADDLVAEWLTNGQIFYRVLRLFPPGSQPDPARPPLTGYRWVWVAGKGTTSYTWQWPEPLW